MELDPSVELEILNCSSYLEDGETEKSRMGWILDTGLSLGTKLVITGFVIVSVPLVLPPLLVTSALGFAFSVPFGFVFASYACTEKLMSKLLPSLSRPQMIDYEPALPKKDEEEIVTVEQEESEQKEDLNDEIETRIELVKQLSSELSKDENPSFDIMGVDTGVGRDATKADESVVVAPEVRNETDKKFGEQNAGSAEETWGGSSAEDMKNSLSIIEVPTHDFMKNDGEKKIESGKSVEDKYSEVEKITRVKGTDKDKKCQTVSKTKDNSSMEIERRGKKKAFTKLKFSGNKKGLRGDKNYKNEVGNPHSSSEEEGKQQQNVVVLKAMREQQSVKDGAEGVITSHRENYNQSSTLPDDSKYSMEMTSLTDTDMSGSKYDEKLPKLKGLEDVFDADSDLLSDKEQFGDEKIWRQIDAIRVIVGFKAPRHPSYFEELKALYTFTGIKMPSSFLDPSDLSEFYHKLQFLKSVIGVK